jgi:hypothetical protein
MEAQLRANAEVIDNLREERTVLVAEHSTLKKRLTEITEVVIVICRWNFRLKPVLGSRSVAKGSDCIPELP